MATIINFADLQKKQSTSRAEQQAISNMSINQLAESMQRIFEEAAKETSGKYKIGQKIYNRGDMANQPGWFEVVNYENGNYDLVEIDGDRKINSLFECAISEIDKGNGSTRFVTEKAYNEYQDKQAEKLQAFLNRYGFKEVEITDTLLKNYNCSIELQSEKEVFGRDLKDSNNEPAFYNKTSRGLKKAWKALTDQFDESTTMHDAMQILNEYKIRTHQWCMMD